MAKRSASRWLAACAASALLLAGVVVFVARERRGADPNTPPVPSQPAAPVPCSIPEPNLPRAEPDAESPPLILWGAGKARLFVDGKAAFSPPEAPLRFSPGLHVVRVEAEGHEPLETRIRLTGWRPALLHAQVDPELGITLVRIGVACASCDPAVTPLGSLDGVPDRRPVKKLLAEAAAALRKDDWRRASELLGGVPKKARRGVAYERLASATWLAASESDEARAAAERVQGDGAHELPALLARLAELEKESSEHYGRVVMARWNRVTEQHSAVLRAAAGTPIDVNRGARRMEALSAAYNVAMEKRDVPEQEQVFLAAESTVKALVSELVAANKDDCDFRARLVTATAGSTP